MGCIIVNLNRDGTGIRIKKKKFLRVAEFRSPKLESFKIKNLQNLHLSVDLGDCLNVYYIKVYKLNFHCRSKQRYLVVLKTQPS